jgi:hypothetical protein
MMLASLVLDSWAASVSPCMELPVVGFGLLVGPAGARGSLLRFARQCSAL